MEHKLKLSVVIAFAITTILFGKAIPTYAATEIRTTVSRSYMDYWEYHNKPGTFRIDGSYTAPQDAKQGQKLYFYKFKTKIKFKNYR